MSHVIELPDDLYRAIERYAAEHGETAEAVIIALAQSVAAQAVPVKPTGEQPAGNGIDDPTRDPWAGFRGVTTLLTPSEISAYEYDPTEDPLAKFLGTGELTQPDAIRRHDEVIADDALDTHE